MNGAGRALPEETPVRDATPFPGVPGGGRSGREPRLSLRPAPAARPGPAVLLLLVATLAAAPMAWGASPEGTQPPPQYIFHLRSGSQIQTSAYWEEGNEYRLERFGGVIGLNKSDVVRIERLEPGAKATPVPAASPSAAAPEPGHEPSQGLLSSISAYVAEMIEWMRAWMARLWTPRRGAGSAPLAQGGTPPARAPQPRDSRPPLLVLIVVVVAVPFLVFGGKRLGSWLFSDSRL